MYGFACQIESITGILDSLALVKSVRYHRPTPDRQLSQLWMLNETGVWRCGEKWQAKNRIEWCTKSLVWKQRADQQVSSQSQLQEDWRLRTPPKKKKGKSPTSYSIHQEALWLAHLMKILWWRINSQTSFETINENLFGHPSETWWLNGWSHESWPSTQ